MRMNDGKMNEIDPLAEIEAMRAMAQSLQPLDEASRRRVLSWASDKFLSLSTVSVAPVPSPSPLEAPISATAAQAGPPSGVEISSFGTLAELFHACSPGGDGEKALVVSAWLQAAGANDGIDSYKVNTELKHLGYGIGNITRALQILVEARPALMIQLRKSGTSQQARKTFRVTDAGLKRVRELIGQNKLLS